MLTVTVTEIAAARDRLASKSRKLASTKPSVSRVAAAFLAKQASTGYDHLIRAFMLEGAAHVRPMTWANGNAASNLRKAQKHFADQGAQMDPTWFTQQDTGTWKVLENRVGAVFRRFGLDDEAKFDVLNSALYGLTKEGVQSLIPAYETGKFARDKILSGDESPKSLAVGYGGKLFVRRALTEIKTVTRRNKLRGKDVDVGEEGDQTEDTNKTEFASAFMDILTDSGSRAGRLWRDLIKSTFMGTAQEEVGKLYWGGWFNGDAPGKREIAKATGKSEQLVWVQLTGIRKKIEQALRSNPGVFSALEDELRGMGAEIEDRGFITDILSPKVAGYDLAAQTLVEVQQILS